MLITRESVARALAELEQAARNFQRIATRVPPSDPAGIARHILDTAQCDAALTSAIGEAQAVGRDLAKDDEDRAILRANTVVAGEGT